MMNLDNHVVGSFLGAGGLVCTGDMVEFPVKQTWYGRLKYAVFTVGLITGGRVVLMSDTYGDITVSRGEAVTHVKDDGTAQRRILERIDRSKGTR